jgi:hypothetical protein
MGKQREPALRSKVICSWPWTSERTTAGIVKSEGRGAGFLEGDQAAGELEQTNELASAR